MLTVLVLSSSPIDQGPLQLGRELKLIRHSLEASINRDQFRVISCTATTVDDLRRYLLEYTPSLVHFCGHGAGQPGLCFENDQGVTHFVDGSRLANLFHLVSDDLKCVVLNACLSEAQAIAISESIDFVVGMKKEVGDNSAIKFSQGFYEAVWAGQSYEKAFKFGCSAIDTANLQEEDTPVIYKSPRLGGSSLRYNQSTQTIENFILQYLNSDAITRANLTTQGSEIVNLIESQMDEVARSWSSVSVLSTKKLDHNIVQVLASTRFGLDASNHTFFLETNGDSILLEWMATVGYWPIAPRTLAALGSSERLEVRAFAALDNYFNYAFKSEKYISVRLQHLSGYAIHGYILRNHPDCSRLVSSLYDGKWRRIIVGIIPDSQHPSHVNIVDFVSDSWVLPRHVPTNSTAGAPLRASGSH